MTAVRRRLLILSFSHLVADARVLRQIRLMAREYHVTTCGYGPAPEEASEHIQIPDDIIAWRKDRKLMAVGRFAAAYRTSPVIEYLVTRVPQRYFDAVIANDIDTVPLALWCQPHAGVHADLHEFASRQSQPTLRSKIFVAPYFRWLTSTFVPACDSVTTVSPGLVDGFQREFGIAAEMVANAPEYVDLEPTPVSRPIRLVHSGSARRSRQLELMIEAVQNTTTDVTLDFYVVPDKDTYLDELKDLAQGGRIHFRDTVPPADLPTVLNSYDVGLFLLPPSTFNFRFTLPNKLYDFVQARLGILIGPSPDMATVVNKYNLGKVASDFTAETFTNELDALEATQIRQWKDAAHRSAHELSAEIQTRGWARAIRRILGATDSDA